MKTTAIEKELLALPAAQRVALAEKLMASVERYTNAEVERAWDEEISNRLDEIRSGKAEAIPAETVMVEARKILNETRRVSPARRKRAA
jgi:putative addiction module component (TIGR02574 family)